MAYDWENNTKNKDSTGDDLTLTQERRQFITSEKQSKIDTAW